MDEQQNLQPASRRRKLTAILMADMVGYSGRIEQDEVNNSDHAARSIDLFKSLIGYYGGRVVQIAGDGILALFESSEEAIRFAVQVQTEFREQARWENGEPIEFRIATNLGEVPSGDEVIHAHCVNVAARLQALADPGAIFATGGVRRAVGNVTEVSFRLLGTFPLKGMNEVVEVFAVERVAVPSPSVSRRGPDPQASRVIPEAQPSVAVLTLTNLTGDPSNEALCDIIGEGVISDLSRFRHLTVIARHSASLFNLKLSSAREIGQRLRARYLLGGSLVRAGRHLRAIVQLIEAESENVIWSDRFEIALGQLFEIQDEITGAVASRLSVQIDFAEHRQESKRPRDMRSYGLVIRGQDMILRFSRQANLHARRLFEEAAELTPTYARAYSAISRTHNLDWRYSWSANPAASLDTAVEAARKAIHLDRVDSRAFAELGFVHLYRKEHDESLADYRRAVALNPNDADVLAEYADSLVYAGDPASSIEIIERAMRLNPYYPDWYLWYLADAQDALGRSEDVVTTVHRMQNPDEGRRLLAANYAHLGMMDEAQAAAREVMRLHPSFRIEQWRDRPPYKDELVFQRYIEGLRKAGLPQ
ncbi:tetratricopeptide repeat protein [Lichenifustis flavocetrariae]|uniref:Tetratricopeptide repeat protein n=1 Tax=Lichenifustis flavocetrariae TaxID=2949735 RepID=A0AA42CH11_9HYPH|nr:tetratricopeptide repeat protein [Lichenifustis flavocetrariae]MCW6506784.1 tetratricopeptide repeat protein [Lichenifustis flavocetrariae]